MTNLETGIQNESKSLENGLKEKTLDEAYKALDGNDSIVEMIGNIDNEKMRSTLENHLNEKNRTPEEIKKEISIFYDEIEPRLSDEDLASLFDRLTSMGRFLPSAILKEFHIRDEILREPDSEAKKIMEDSLKTLFPSEILDNREIYEKFASVENPDEKEMISYYFSKGFSPKLVDEQYEDYLFIKKYDNEDVRDLALAYVVKGKDPSLAMLSLDLFHEIAGYGAETKDYILGLINEWETDYSVEALLAKAHYYKKN